MTAREREREGERERGAALMYKCVVSSTMSRINCAQRDVVMCVDISNKSVNYQLLSVSCQREIFYTGTKLKQRISPEERVKQYEVGWRIELLGGGPQQLTDTGQRENTK